MRKILLTIFALLLPVTAALAHFAGNSQYRVFLLDREEEQLFIRIAAPLIFAEDLAARKRPDDPIRSEFIEAREINGQWIYRLDTAAIAARPDAFMNKIAGGYEIFSGGNSVDLTPQSVAVHLKQDLPPFADIGDARAALGETTGIAPYIADAVVDISIALGPLSETVAIRNRLPEIDLPLEVSVDNHFLDWKGGGVELRDVSGQLLEPVILERSLPRTIGRYVVEGVKHILEGPDHVLFVICLVLASASFSRLIWTVSGFTIGHTITLIAGFLGFAPSVNWFIPAVEAAIAASIVYAGAVALLGRARGPGIVVTAGLGLLHGFGFSFVLADVLGRQSPDLILSLLSFNIGVEIGQLAIVAVVFALLGLSSRAGAHYPKALRLAGASLAIVIAAYWLIERVELIGDVI
ncbi:HupE/UreJ family protein [Roseibium marinum]|uniref:Hydrogenase/urease accessory protein HupE n=1 Tax=Roseibium marinum TaxID=281252 RepID=A0A2S3UK23_9HYPH|nr:HupE/UreJ family protein [Roseibium marinum]POF28047.1 hydrogenase/urease accessory protein HupE [Roseibium marinum]